MANRVMYLHYRLTGGDYKTYESLVEISLASARRYLAGKWSPLILHGDYSNRPYERGFSEMYRIMFQVMRKCYDAGDNVLFLDPDTLFIKETEVFGRFTQMMLFWPTDPAKRRHFDPYLNAGIVYVPATMDAKLWRFANAAPMMSEWNDSQDIFNEMFYAQRPVPELHPELNWSPNVPSTIRMDEASLLHFNSTRGALGVLETMRELAS